MEKEYSFKFNFNTVKEMILDEEKIITYVSLSKDLCIHINDSKKMLHYFVKKMSEDDPNTKLNVNFIISGISDDNKARTTVCTEDNLKKLKLTFKSVLFEHIYSVSKGSSCTDYAAYLLLSKFDDFSLCSGIINNTECSKRTSDEIGGLKVISQHTALTERKEAVIPSKKIKIENEKSTKVVKNIQTGDQSSVEVIEKIQSKIKTEVISPKKDVSKTNHKSNNQKSQKGIAGFFNKPPITVNKKVLKEPKPQAEKTQTKSISIKEENMDIDNHEPEPEKVIKDEQTHQKNKVLNQIKKNSKVDKKRKRVLHVSDSDSNDENDPFLDKQETNNESDDEIPPTPAANNIKITSGIVNPKKRRKIVDKTYTNEDGYIITKKEEIYESCSENEEEVTIKPNVKERKQEKIEISPKKKNGTKPTKKKISSPQKGKQSTLAQFFKKV